MVLIDHNRWCTPTVVLGAIFCCGVPTLDHLADSSAQAAPPGDSSAAITLDHGSADGPATAGIAQQRFRILADSQLFQCGKRLVCRMQRFAARRRCNSPLPTGSARPPHNAGGSARPIARVFEQMAAQVVLVHALHHNDNDPSLLLSSLESSVFKNQSLSWLRRGSDWASTALRIIDDEISHETVTRAHGRRPPVASLRGEYVGVRDRAIRICGNARWYQGTEPASESRLRACRRDRCRS